MNDETTTRGAALCCATWTVFAILALRAGRSLPKPSEFAFVADFAGGGAATRPEHYAASLWRFATGTGSHEPAPDSDDEDDDWDDGDDDDDDSAPVTVVI